MFSVTHDSRNQLKKNEYSMFVSINANDEKLDDKIIYYYPNEKIEIDKITIYPEKPSFYLDFYKKNLDKYQKISQSVKLLIAINYNFTKYTTSTGNIVKLKCENKEKLFVLSSFSLIKKLELDSDEMINKIEIFMVGKCDNMYQFLKKMDFLMTLITPKDKIIFFEAIKKEFNLIQLEKDIPSLGNRSQFLKAIEFTEYEYLFKDPRTDKFALPGLDILILNMNIKKLGSNKDYFSEIHFIEIDLDLIEQNRNTNDDFLTYITYHIPRQKIDSIIGKKRRVKLSYKSSESNLNKLPADSKVINYEDFRCLEFSKSCSVLYDRSINFGRCEKNSFQSGLRIGHYSFNENSAGTLLFNSELKPIGLAYFGSFDFYPLSETKKLYNIFLPFKHVGVLYVLKNYLKDKEENFKLTDFLVKHNINLINGNFNMGRGKNKIQIEERIKDKECTPDKEFINSNCSDIEDKQNEICEMQIDHDEAEDITEGKQSDSENVHTDEGDRKIKKRKRRQKIAKKEKFMVSKENKKMKNSSEYPLTRSRKTIYNKKKFRESEKYIEEKLYIKKKNKLQQS